MSYGDKNYIKNLCWKKLAKKNVIKAVYFGASVYIVFYVREVANSKWTAFPWFHFFGIEATMTIVTRSAIITSQ